MIRPPAVAGRFYPASPQELARELDGLIAPRNEKIAARGCVVPHAGYVYSGRVAGEVFSSIEIPARCILLGPRHYPRGEPLAILSEGSWQTPLGLATIDSALAAELKREFPALREDRVAHEREHSLEVQIPFLQRLRPDIQFVPVVLGTDRYPRMEELGQAVARVVNRRMQRSPRENVLVIASTDMNHYESEAVTRAKDERAIARILGLDAAGLHNVVRAEGISMCGYAATVAMVTAMRELGARQAELVRYATSGEVNGDFSQVVGYAGCVVRA